MLRKIALPIACIALGAVIFVGCAKPESNGTGETVAKNDAETGTGSGNGSGTESTPSSTGTESGAKESRTPEIKPGMETKTTDTPVQKDAPNGAKTPPKGSEVAGPTTMKKLPEVPRTPGASTQKPMKPPKGVDVVMQEVPDPSTKPATASTPKTSGGKDIVGKFQFQLDKPDFEAKMADAKAKGKPINLPVFVFYGDKSFVMVGSNSFSKGTYNIVNDELKMVPAVAKKDGKTVQPAALKTKWKVEPDGKTIKAPMVKMVRLP